MIIVVLITGANRGIGACLAKHFLARGDKVIACVRNPADPELKDKGFSQIVSLDLFSDESIMNLGVALKDTPIDIALLNAGVLKRDSLGDSLSTVAQNCTDTFRVNATSPLLTAMSLLPSVKLGKSKTIVLMTSRMGSVEDNGSGAFYSYRSSKAALNAIAKSLAVDLKPEGINICLLHPGMVSTGMTGGKGDDVEVATAKLMERIDEASMSKSGVFLHRDGSTLPW